MIYDRQRRRTNQWRGDGVGPVQVQVGGVQSGERCGIVTLQEFVRPKKQRHILTRLMTNCFCSFLVLVLPFLRTSLPLVRTPFIDLAARPPPVICSSRQPHPQSTNVPFEPPLRITQQSHHTSLSNDYTTAHFLPFLTSSIPPSLPPSLHPSSPLPLTRSRFTPTRTISSQPPR